MPLPRWPTRQVDGLREYAWLDDTPLAMATGAVASPAWSYIHTGNLGEPVMLTNAAGAMTASVTRDPWGNPILIAGTNPLALGYPGQWKDLAGGLWHNHNRDYDPTLGRYTEADPIGLAGGANLYGYVGGNPVNWVDPEGLRARSRSWGIPFPWPGTIGPDSNGNGISDWTEGAARQLQRGLDQCGEIILGMAKGGRQRIENEWSREAKASFPDPKDRCKWLREWYNRPEVSPANKRKIWTAMKDLGCTRRGPMQDE